MDSRPPLINRLKTRAAAAKPDKAAATISKIIEVRSVLAEQRLRGLSWAALTRLLSEEGVNMAEGTLRNYVRMIGAAEAALRAKGNPEPTDTEIHAALYFRSGTPTAQPLMRTPHKKPSLPSLPRDEQTNPPRPELAPTAARPSIIRNPDRDL